MIQQPLRHSLPAASVHTALATGPHHHPTQPDLVDQCFVRCKNCTPSSWTLPRSTTHVAHLVLWTSIDMLTLHTGVDFCLPSDYAARLNSQIPGSFPPAPAYTRRRQPPHPQGECSRHSGPRAVTPEMVLSIVIPPARSSPDPLTLLRSSIPIDFCLPYLAPQLGLVNAQLHKHRESVIFRASPALKPLSCSTRAPTKQVLSTILYARRSSSPTHCSRVAVLLALSDDLKPTDGRMDLIQEDKEDD
jgi:hypothetical protein